MARKKKQAKINLLPREDFSNTTFGRILSWVLSTFRIIVIVTEILVMLAFLSRFWLDAQNTDLNEELKQKQAVLAASATFEDQFKDAQARLKIFSEYAANEGDVTNLIKTINSRLPSDVVLKSITFNNQEIQLAGVSSNERAVQQFIVNLYDEDSITGVDLQEASFNEESQALEFRINIVSSNKQ